MEKETRNAIQLVTQKARRALEGDFRKQLEGVYDVHVDGTIAHTPGTRLSAKEQRQRDRIVAAIEHKRSGGMKADEAVLDYLRDAAFTTLNRLVALKMLEARGIVQECISRGDASSGFVEFSGLAPGIKLPDGSGYRLYLECIFDELSTEVKVLFDRRDPSAVLWPRRATFEQILELFNASELAGVWGEDETIGWVYQFFNSQDERRRMREESQAPRNSRELAIRNQFFTPRYVVQFLSDNTLGRIWYEMRDGDTRLRDLCEYMVRRPDETWEPRTKKDPRDMRVLDPACGSGHFLLYCFDLLLVMYEEAWADEASPTSEVTGKTLRKDYPEIADLQAALPGLILRHNLHGVDIDPRCAQIGQLALWMRAQRAFRELGLGRAERPIIKRANIVIAEPMPGEKDLLKEFLAELKEDKLEELIRRALDVPADKRVRATKAMANSLAELVETVWDGMKLAGEMGTLLKIERDLARAIDNGRAEWEETLPLFRVADYGLGGITSEKLVRVVPGEQEDFWTKAEKLVFQALADYAAAASGSSNARRRLFAEDAAQGFALADMVAKKFDVVLMNPPFGAPPRPALRDVRVLYPNYANEIYSCFISRMRDLAPDGMVGCITARSFISGRRQEVLRREIIIPFARVIWDLGAGVMDSAMVQSAAYVIGQSCDFGLFCDSRYVDRKQFLGSLQSKSRFQAYPHAKLLWEAPPAVERVLTGPIKYEPVAGTAREGMKTFDNRRFLRLWWEVSPISSKWLSYAKGGENSEFVTPPHLVLNRYRQGQELDAINMKLNGSTAQVRQASTYWFRAGATYSRRSAKFAARALPRGVVFSDKGPAILPTELVDQNLHLGWLNSEVVRAMVTLQSNSNDFHTGNIKSLPWCDMSADIAEIVSENTLVILGKCMAREAAIEVSPYFVRPKSHGLQLATWEDEKREIDLAVLRAYGLSDDDLSFLRQSAVDDDDALESEVLDETDDETDSTVSEVEDAGLNETRLSWCVGICFGRFDPRIATGERTECQLDPFDRLPSRSPAMYPEGEEPTDRPDILVDDAGHPKDITAHVQRWAEHVGVEVPADLSPWLSREFFSLHVKMYSKSRRKAPIYWQMATRSASYSVWLYIHTFTKDTLFRVQNDYVAGKLAHEERQLETLRAEAGPDPITAQRKTIEGQEAFVEELRTFLDEVKRVAPLWNPNLDDGVIINFAPLWRLVPHHKPWQKELKSTWDALCAGKYDWAHLAMHLWPERVVPQCGEDRSLAIAHNLEDVFWYQDDDEKWKPREEPTRPIDALVKERTSSAVKAVLKSLMEAPEQAGGARRGRGRRR